MLGSERSDSSQMGLLCPPRQHGASGVRVRWVAHQLCGFGQLLPSVLPVLHREMARHPRGVVRSPCKEPGTG